MVVAVAVACSSEDPDPRNCSCAATAMPAGFYEISQSNIRRNGIYLLNRRIEDGGEQLVFDFGFQFGDGELVATPLTGQLDGCLFSGRSTVFDLGYSQYDGVWSCKRQRFEGERFDSSGFLTVETVFEPTAPPWWIGEGVYRLYGAESHFIPHPSDPPYYYPDDLGYPRESVWELVGEARETSTFQLSKPYPFLMLTWPRSIQFSFDAIVDDVSGRALSDAFAEREVGFGAHATADPNFLAGPPDQVGFAGVPGHAGFVEVTFPDVNSAPAIDPETGSAQVTIHLVESTIAAF